MEAWFATPFTISFPVEILDISIGKLIDKADVNHASKEYEFSHFFPYSDSLQYMQPVKREGKSILPKPFAYDDVSIDVLDSKFQDEDQVESDLGIKDEVQTDLDPYLVPTPNPRPKWAQKFIKAIGSMAGDSFDKRRT